MTIAATIRSVKARTKSLAALRGFVLPLLLAAIAASAGTAPVQTAPAASTPIAGRGNVVQPPKVDSVKPAALNSATVTVGDSVRPVATDSAPSSGKDTVGIVAAPVTTSWKRAAGTFADTAKTSPKDSFNVHNATFIAVGAGLSLGSNPVFSLWKGSLPTSLSDFGYPSGQTIMGADSLTLAFTSRETPDVYNMTFPITLSFGRLSRDYRYGATASFSWTSKTAKSSLIEGPDSLHRHIDITQGLDLYAVSLDIIGGRRLPKRYFTIDGVDRSDIVLGLSATPFIALKKSASIAASASDPLLDTAKSRAVACASSFSSTGIAFGWRVGIVSVRRMSKTGGLETGLSYFGLWSMHFQTDQRPLIESDLNAKSGSGSRHVSYYSGRIEFTVSLVHKVW
jgi:hypothetical protein